MNRLLALCAGLMLGMLWPVLLPWPLLLVPTVMTLPCWWRLASRWVMLGMLLLGAGYGSFRAAERLATALPPDLAGKIVTVQGTVRGLADAGEFGVRFRFEVTSTGQGEAVPSLLWLQDARGQTWPAGSRWWLRVRLRPASGLRNVAGFDAARWFWSEGILATGTVSKGRIAQADAGLDARAWLDRSREALLRRLHPANTGEPSRSLALVAALGLGAQQWLPREAWQRLSRTGLTHVVSVSGLHISMLAWLVATSWRRLARRWPQRLPVAAALPLGGLAALTYALLAGWSVPTQRTVWMLAVAGLCQGWHRQLSGWQIWLAALTVVLLIDPFAAHAAGFWLSFGLVGALIAGEHGLRQPGAKWRRAARAQWQASLASLLPLAIWFGQYPLLSPLANALAIPLVSCLLTPLSLLLVAWPWPLLHRLALMLADGFWWWVDWLAQWPVWTVPAWPWPLQAAATLGTLLLLWPLGRHLTWLGCGLLLPLLLYRVPSPAIGTAQITVLDVGQGLSVLIRTRQHALLYDTGAGEADRVVLPVLAADGVRVLDGLMLSHHDADHDGAAESMLAAVPVRQLWRSQPGSAPAWPGRRCEAGQHWQWDGVQFAVLWPPRGWQGEDNSHSCILRVQAGRQRVLLTGDAPQAVEAALVSRHGRALAAQVLLAGHHGSRSSTGEAWLQAVQPQHVLISAGAYNRYRHPHPEVLARLDAARVRVWRTDRLGAILLTLGDEGRLATLVGPAYWRP